MNLFTAKTLRTQRKGYLQANSDLRASGGFTLVEVLAALVIMGLALAMMIMPFMSGMDYLKKGRARSTAQSSARQIMDTLDRDLSQAMDVYLQPGDPGLDGAWNTADDIPSDPGICAFVPPAAGSMPLQPSNSVIRYWQVLRSDPNLDPDSTLGRPTSDNCWRDKFNPNPRLNKATANDRDSRFLARTEFANSTGVLTFHSDDDGDGIGYYLDRSIPATNNPIADKQNFIAIGPSEPDFDIYLLKFASTPVIGETLKRDSDYAFVFYSRYPLWETDWQISVYDAATGALDLTNFTPAENPFTVSTIPVGVGVDFNRGTVSFISEWTEAITANTNMVVAFPTVIPNSERVVVGGQLLTRVGSSPDTDEYTLDYTTGTLNLNALVTPNPADRITYKYATIPSTDIVVADYNTRALLNVSLTVSKRDSRDGVPQDMHLERRIKLKNVVR